MYGDRGKKLSLRRLKRHLCKVPGRSVSIDVPVGLAGLTVIDDGDSRGNGEHDEPLVLNHPGVI